MILDSVVLPFLGSREEDHICYEYILHDVEPDWASIIIPEWVVNRERLKAGDIVNLHLPFELDQRIFRQGTVEKTSWDDSAKSQECLIWPEQGHREPLGGCISIQSFGTRIDLREFTHPDNLAAQILKDSILLKKGVLIYLDHLVPFFSRVSELPTDQYTMLRGFLFDDIRGRVKENGARLKSLYDTINTTDYVPEDISKLVNLEELRSFMESEIYSDLFRIAFDNDLIMRYISAIKELENKLYCNYNTIVMLFIKYL